MPRPKACLATVPEMMAYVFRTQRVFCWLTSLTTRHRSAMVQAFVKPFGARPWVVVTDPHESQDLLLRRTREFDRSGFFGELIGGILSEQHIQFLSGDVRFRDNRRLINQPHGADLHRRRQRPRGSTAPSTPSSARVSRPCVQLIEEGHTDHARSAVALGAAARTRAGRRGCEVPRCTTHAPSPPSSSASCPSEPSSTSREYLLSK